MELFVALISRNFYVKNLEKSNKCTKLIAIFEKKLVELVSRSKAGKLWVSFIRMISVEKDFYAAERRGDCNICCVWRR